MPENERKPGARSRKSAIDTTGNDAIAQTVGKPTIDATQFEAMLNTAIQSLREEMNQELAQMKEELAPGAEDEDENELLEQMEEIMSQPEPEMRQLGGRTFVPFTTRYLQNSAPSIVVLEPRKRDALW